MSQGRYEIGMVGLGTMGRNLLLNLADHGHAVAGFDSDPEKLDALASEAGTRDVRGARSLAELCALLRTPRAVMLLVPAGEAVDQVIGELRGHLAAGDLIVDGGNSFYRDTDRRAAELEGAGLELVGLGVSGGEEGARHGPSLMAGGPATGWRRLEKLLTDVAAKVDGEPCAAHLGPGSAGHYVKMVHNGIEYALMELLAECYDLARRGLGMSNDEIGQLFGRWNEGETAGFLVELTAEIFTRDDPATGRRLIDLVRDVAGQKGTGMWTSAEAMAHQVATPTVHAAVAARDLSTVAAERRRASELLRGPASPPTSPTAPPAGGREAFLGRLHNAYYVAMVLSFAQGLALLGTASEANGYGLGLATVARIWRGGCILRSAFLETVRAVYGVDPESAGTPPVNLLLAPGIAAELGRCQEDLRSVVAAAAALGIPVPGLASALAYYDGYRSARLPTNLIQAQRDAFGSHTYERVDAAGAFHSDW